MAAREDVLFRTFRSSADPRALAEVFDRTAPEVMRVALHLTGNIADAEDLVQATFLEVIECASGYDETRRVMPWLLGILVNQARLCHRRRQRMLDHARVAVPAPGDPVADAQQSELHAALERAIGALPDSYREVFRLALRQGLSAAEISCRLSRPQGTVRSQMVRGWELLRRSLPPGFAVTALVLATAPRGLAAVRAAVLAHAKTLPVVPLVASTVGIAMLVKKTLFSTAVILLLLCGVWLGWPRSEPQQQVPAAPQATPIATAGMAKTAVQTANVREAVAPARPEASAQPGLGGLSVRVLWSNGAPAACVGIAVTPADSASPALEERVARTDLGGRADLRDLAAGRIRIRTDRTESIPFVIAAGERREAELRIPEGVTVRGVVYGAGRRPLAHAELHVSEKSHPSQCMLAGWSGDDGTFALQGLENGRFVSAFAVGHAAADPVEVAGQIGGSMEVELVLKPAPGSLRGRVVDAAGLPVASATVMVGRESDAGTWLGSRRLVESPPMRLRTGADGRFHVDGGVFARVLIWVRAPGFALWKGRVPALENDAAEVTVQLLRGGSVRGTFRDDAGTALRGCPVWIGPHDEEAPDWGRLQTTTRDDGSFEIGCIAAGSREVAACPEVGENVHATLDVAEGQVTAWNPVAVRGLEIRGRVVDERAAGLAGFRVEARDQDGRSTTADSQSDGSFRVAGLHTGEHLLLVHDPDAKFRFTAAIVPKVIAGASDVEVRLLDSCRATACVTGVVLAPDGTPVPPARVTLMREPFEGGPWLHTDPRTGGFDSGLVPPGRYRMRGFFADYPIIDLGEFTLAPRERLDLGTHQLQAPAAIEVNVGDAAAKGWLCVREPDGKLALGCDIVNGAARAAPLLAGKYRVTGWCRGTSPFARELEVRAGEVLRLQVALQTGLPRTFRFVPPHPEQPLTLRLCWRDGAGASLWEDGYDWRNGTNAEASKTLAPGSYVLDVTSEDGKLHATVPFLVAENGSDAPITVTLW